MTRAPNGKPILNEPDAEGLYTCQYTGLKVSREDAIFLGACTPQVNGTYVCHSTALPAFRKSKRMFDESEANCNTCKHLVRVKHEPRKDGQLRGTCKNNTDLLFHPDDFMGMNCYEQRLEKNT